MAVAILIEIPGATTTQYDAVIKDVFPGGRLPRGLIFHVAGPAEGALRVVDVWDSRQSFDSFAQTTLGAAMQKAGIPQQPIIKEWPVHKTVHSH